MVADRRRSCRGWWRIGTRDDETRGRSTQGTDRCCWLRERFSGSSAGRPWPLPCMGEELLRGREKTRKKTEGAAAVFGLRKKGTAAGLCWVELETVRRKWEASVQRAGLGCRCWRMMWVWPWLVFVRGSCCGAALVLSSAFPRPKGGRWLRRKQFRFSVYFSALKCSPPLFGFLWFAFQRQRGDGGGLLVSGAKKSKKMGAAAPCR